MADMLKNYRNIEAEIEKALSRKGSHRNAKVLVVTKGREAETIKKLWDLNIKEFGENRVNELIDKAMDLPEGIGWHFIGHLQRNKVRQLVRLQGLKLIHSVDSVRLARKISEEAVKEKTMVNILLQVNVAGEKQKYGFSEQEMLQTAKIIGNLPGLNVKGLMTMAPISADPEEVRPYFGRLKIIADEIEAENIPGLVMEELSMGMTQDYLVAIEEGATIIRIGRAIFA